MLLAYYSYERRKRARNSLMAALMRARARAVGKLAHNQFTAKGDFTQNSRGNSRLLADNAADECSHGNDAAAGERARV